MRVGWLVGSRTASSPEPCEACQKVGLQVFIVLMGISLRKQGRYSGIVSSSQGRDILLRDLASAALETNPQQDQRGPQFKRTAPPCLEWKQDFVQTTLHHVWRASTIKQCRIVSGFGVRIPACMSCHCLCCLGQVTSLNLSPYR